MKYVIEINDHAMNDSCTPALYRAKGFRALVFDQNGLNKLTPFEPERIEAWNEGYDAGKQIGEQIGIQEVKQEYFDKGYKVGKHDADMEGYDRGYESGYAQCKEDMKCGYDEGVEAGKNAMKEIVINNLRKILERG